MTKPLIAIAQPSAGHAVPHKGAAKAFYRPTLRELDRIELEQGSSMLPRVFNMLWANALNLRAQHPITHFAMLHDDVCPADGWLDTLLDEITTTGADVVSCVVPIKDHHGLTSTAVENPADPWIVRRLTLKEVFDMPETFGAEHVPWRDGDACLLPNTGCWICRFDQPWVEQVAFRFQNRIVKMPDGVFVGQDMPEDWDFGRQLRDLGRKVLCTRKVGLEHERSMWHNKFVWGHWNTDMSWLEWNRLASMPPDTTQVPEGWKFPADVFGWLTEREGKTLANVAKGKTVVEIGSYCGRSTVCMAQTANAVHAIDTFDGRATTVPQETLSKFAENIVRYGVADKITVHVGTAEESIGAVPDCDVAFIDAAHDRESVDKDIHFAKQVLNENGIMVFHDYRRPGDDGVTGAVDHLISTGAKLLEVNDTVAVLQLVA